MQIGRSVAEPPRARRIDAAEPVRSDLQQRFDFLEVSNDRSKMPCHRGGSLLVAVAQKQIENVQMLAAWP